MLCTEFPLFEIVCYAVATLAAIKIAELIFDESAPLAVSEEMAAAAAVVVAPAEKSIPDEPSNELPKLTLDFLPPDDVKPKLNLDDTKLYKLHGQDVVHVSDVSALDVSIPETVKRRTLRGALVVRVAELKGVFNVSPVG